METDVVIIGGGPAGVSAALYAARSGFDVCIVDGGESALLRAERIQNYYGTGTVTGAALYAAGLTQARDVGAAVVNAQVTSVRCDGGFTVSTTAGELIAKKLIIATGAARLAPDIPGLSELTGAGVSYCAVCDAFFCRGKRVGVIGAGEYARHEYGTLAAVADAYLFTDGKTPEFTVPDGRLITDRIARITAGDNGRVSGVALESGGTVAVDAVFVAVGVLGATGLAKSLGVFTDGNSIITDARGMTNIPGLYAAGDCTAGPGQVAHAVAGGMAAGLAVVAELKAEVRA